MDLQNRPTDSSPDFRCLEILLTLEDDCQQSPPRCFGAWERMIRVRMLAVQPLMKQVFTWSGASSRSEATSRQASKLFVTNLSKENLCEWFSLHFREVLERVKGIEPSTRSLGSYCSTTELHPPAEGLGLSIQMHGDKGAQPGEPSFLAAPGLRGAFPKTAKPSRERHATLEVALKTAAPVSDALTSRSKRLRL